MQSKGVIVIVVIAADVDDAAANVVVIGDVIVVLNILCELTSICSPLQEHDRSALEPTVC